MEDGGFYKMEVGTYFLVIKSLLLSHFVSDLTGCRFIHKSCCLFRFFLVFCIWDLRGPPASGSERFLQNVLLVPTDIFISKGYSFVHTQGCCASKAKIAMYINLCGFSPREENYSMLFIICFLYRVQFFI